jgi:ribosomal protein L11 methyltransferase
MTAQYVLPRATGDDPDVLAGRLWLAGAEGVWVRPDDVVGYFPSRDAPVPDGGRWEAVPEVDWAARWVAGIEPVAAGPVDVVPTWLADEHPERPGRTRVVLDPGRAFGSGHHDTTIGCLEALADLDLRGRSVLDVGTGTGVLAIAAARRGADPVVGVDVDPDAVEVARANADANGVTLVLAVGSVGGGPVPPVLRDRRGGFDVVVANVLTQTIVDLARPLVASVAPGGHLVASGIGLERSDRVVAALAAAGLVTPTTRARGEWAIVTGRRPRP